MSKLMGYVETLADEIGPRPASTDSEFHAAEWIRSRFESHGLAPEFQEFESPRTYSWSFVIYHLATLVAAVISGLFAWLTPIAFVLALASAAVMWSELDTRWGLSRLMPKGPSQNVIARHIPKSSHGERVRKIVIVAHYDSARASLAFSPGMVSGFPVTFALMKWCTWLTPVMILAQMVAPAAADPWVWYATMLVSAYLLIPLFINIHREVAMGYVAGANDNASGVAAMLGVLDRVLPIEGEDEEAAEQVLFGPETLIEEDVVPAGAVLVYEDEVPFEPDFSAQPQRLPGIDPRPSHERPAPAVPPMSAPAPEQAELPIASEDLGATRPFVPVSVADHAEPSLRSSTPELTEFDLEALLPPIEPDARADKASSHAETWDAGTHLDSGIAEDFTPIPESRMHELADRVTGLFKRVVPKKKPRGEEPEEISDWLGVEEFTARKAGEDIGSWENFGDDDDAGWKGGAVGLMLGEPERETVSQTVSRIRETVLAVADRDLLDKEIWFVATGAEEVGTVGMQAFLSEHGPSLKGAFIINLDNLGAGDLSWISAEGMARLRPSDRRLQFLARRVSRERSIDVKTSAFKGLSTDASAALARGYSAGTLMGLERGVPVNWHWKTDTSENVDEQNLVDAVSLVTGIIRES